jgi:hypothetical protein
MDKIQRYEPDWDFDNCPSLDAVSIDSSGRMIYVDDLLVWTEEHRFQMDDTQVLLKLIEELRKS